jgi:hypothetical protein
MTKYKETTFLTTKAVFTLTLIVVFLTIIGVWLLGIGRSSTIIENSLLSTTILSIGFFLFLAFGLYKGAKLKDNIGELKAKIHSPEIPDFSDSANGADIIDSGDGIAGILLSILLWIVVSILLSLFIWFFGVVLWTSIIVFVAMLYWVYFRAVRLVFKNSKTCKGNLKRSVAHALLYTCLYSFWIYGIILLSYYLKW